jgi:hypothetical protein
VTDVSDVITVEAPELISTGAQAIVARAQSLGLTWEIRPGTVAATSGVVAGSVTFDGDTVPVNCLNLTNQYLTSGSRVMGILVPPSSNYIISALMPMGETKNFNAGPGGAGITGGSTGSTTFVAFPGSPTVRFTKGSNATKLRLDILTACYVTANGVVEVGLRINGIDYFVGRHALPLVTSYFPIGGHKVLLPADVTAGSFDCILLWRKTTGGGIVAIDADGFVSFTIQEVW